MSDTLEILLSNILVETLCDNFRIDISNLEDLTVMALQLYVIAKRKFLKGCRLLTTHIKTKVSFHLTYDKK